MSKIIEIRKAINSFLKSKHPNVIVKGESRQRVFFEVAVDDAPVPYLVYDLPNSFTLDESTETFVLEIDGWDAPANGDTTALETLMSFVNDGEDGLHKKVIIVNGIGMVFNLENRLPLRDDNRLIRRQKYKYEIKTYGG